VVGLVLLLVLPVVAVLLPVLVPGLFMMSK
jgi:hypothetical protein